MPVFNEVRFIDSALKALRNQSYPNLEIVISDNASTDGTLAICEQHAAEDPRIRIERSGTNRGVTGNFRHALSAARGEYFMWAAGHDLWSQTLVSECVDLLESHPDASLAFPSSHWIDDTGQLLGRESGWSDTRGLSASARLFTVLWGNMHPVMGVMRADLLRTCGSLPNLVGGDLVLLSILSLRGHFLHARTAEWSRREFRRERNYAEKVRRYSSDTVGIARTPFARAFPLLELPMALCRVVLESHLRPGEKAAALLALICSFPLRYLVGRRQSHS